MRDGVDRPLAKLFVHVAREVTPTDDGILRARSATEAFLYRRLETLAETTGRFRLNAELPIPFDGSGHLEVDLLCADARLAIELDGSQHLDGEDAYRRDRRKDLLLQEHGYFVLRFLAADVGIRLDIVLDTILRACCRTGGAAEILGAELLFRCARAVRSRAQHIARKGRAEHSRIINDGVRPSSMIGGSPKSRPELVSRFRCRLHVRRCTCKHSRGEDLAEARNVTGCDDVLVEAAESRDHVRISFDRSAKEVDRRACERNMRPDVLCEAIVAVVSKPIIEVGRPIIVKYGDDVKSPCRSRSDRRAIPPH